RRPAPLAHDRGARGHSGRCHACRAQQCRYRRHGPICGRGRSGALSAACHLRARRRRQAAGCGPHSEAPDMMKFWMAPGGLHVEPGEMKDAKELARIHGQSFFRGWPTEEFASFLSDRNTPVYVACDAKRRMAGFALIRTVADESEL